MKRFTTLTMTTGLLLFLGLMLPNGDAVGQQQTGSTQSPRRRGAMLQ
jgi:hypothetical protein